MITAQDFERYYSGTYLGYKLEDIIHPVYVRGVNSTSSDYTISVNLVHENQIFSISPESGALVYDYPDLGYAELGGQPVWLERLPSRQWHKGVKPSLVNVVSLSGAGKLNNYSPSDIVTLLKYIYNNDYSSTVKKHGAMYNNTLFYKGIKVCSVEDLHTLPEELSYVKEYLVGELGL